MPFPWKKVKNTKISQLVNDHLHHSQKRRDGSSLVVETGFPTSLVDLFIKNREKLKKPSKKKRQKNPPMAPAHVDYLGTGGSPAPMPCSVPPPSPINWPVTAEWPSRPQQYPSPMRSSAPLPSKGTNEIVLLDGPDEDEKERDFERRVDAKGVLLGVLKIFLVVMLALGTKRLTIGITISAFLLFFFEYVGQYVCVFFRPCLEAKGILKMMMKRVWRLLRLEDNNSDEENGCVEMPEVQQEGFLKSRCASTESTTSRCLEEVFQIAEPKACLENNSEGVLCEKEILVDNSSEGRRGYQEIETIEKLRKREESGCELEELKRRKWRREKIKSKIKKIVPKKLRSSRKEEQNLDRSDDIGEENFSLHAEKDVGESNGGWESESASRFSSTSCGGHKEEDGMSAICALGLISKASEETTTNKEEEGEEAVTALSWRHLVLCLIILIGLIGGRAFALLLTVLWTLLLKYGENLARCERVPIIRSLFNAMCG